MELNIRPYGDVLITAPGDRPQDVGRGRPMALHIGQYKDVLKTLHWNVLRTSYFNVLRTLVGDVPWCYIGDHMGTSIGRRLETSLGCNFAECVPYYFHVMRRKI